MGQFQIASPEIRLPPIFPSALIGFAYPERNYITITLYSNREPMYYAARSDQRRLMDGKSAAGRADIISAAKSARKRTRAHAEDAIYHSSMKTTVTLRRCRIIARAAHRAPRGPSRGQSIVRILIFRTILDYHSASLRSVNNCGRRYWKSTVTDVIAPHRSTPAPPRAGTHPALTPRSARCIARLAWTLSLSCRFLFPPIPVRLAVLFSPVSSSRFLAVYPRYA